MKLNNERVTEIYQKFFDTNVAKQDNIISAAIKEFALYGYNDASTNRIVADAGISKGILFHYFGSKQNLFEFIAEYCSLILIGDYYDKLNKAQNDFFVLLEDMLDLRFRLTEVYPYVFLFYDRMKNDGGEQSTEFLKGLAGYTYEELFKRCTRSYFNSAQDYDTILQNTEWVVEGFIKSVETKQQVEKKKALTEFISSYRRILSIK